MSQDSGSGSGSGCGCGCGCGSGSGSGYGSGDDNDPVSDKIMKVQSFTGRATTSSGDSYSVSIKGDIVMHIKITWKNSKREGYPTSVVCEAYYINFVCEGNSRTINNVTYSIPGGSAKREVYGRDSYSVYETFSVVLGKVSPKKEDRKNIATALISVNASVSSVIGPDNVSVSASASGSITISWIYYEQKIAYPAVGFILCFVYIFAGTERRSRKILDFLLRAF